MTIQSTGVAAAGTYIDSREDIFPAYGVSDQANVIFLVRPDGYVGLTATTGWGDAIIGYLSRIGIQITP